MVGAKSIMENTSSGAANMLSARVLLLGAVLGYIVLPFPC